MILIPAIDLKEGHCVRLRQGNMDESTVFSDDPVAMAGKWAPAVLKPSASLESRCVIEMCAQPMSATLKKIVEKAD